MTKDKKKAELLRKILNKISSKVPGNSICADCKAKYACWASWNLGIFICVKCAGAHRGLGTHISRVKSVDLDEWNETEISVMQNIGNVNSNIAYENKLTIVEYNSIMNVSRDLFISKKYREKIWLIDDYIAPERIPINTKFL
ncbi:hypothetical protein A3Q56_06748 [Intoshia linei]|uniref:Arf-GAP domain-containing protein n=1 Tax=Intoshia linei TaxID=1819745 RepID=A0A177AWH2_9BILA|nr:hypothetical protein A3Q56_06748 [Intoshia linei]